MNLMYDLIAVEVDYNLVTTSMISIAWMIIGHPPPCKQWIGT